MDNYGINMKGPLLVEENESSLPEWTSDDERRLLYVNNVLYYGTSTGWAEAKTSDSDLKKLGLL